MKYLLIFTALTIIFSCSNEETKTDAALETVTTEITADTTKETSVEITEVQTENKAGLFQEFYPNGALKIEGKNDEDGQRNGLWIAYYENGTKWSESYYVKGKKSGHSLSFYPNGNVRYVGEYLEDVKTGTWKFYDENGDLTSEETF